MKYIIKKLIAVLIGLVWFFGSCAICLTACDELTPFSVSVSGYYRSDGTYVRQHSRRPPGGAQHDKPYEILGFISFVSIVASAAFVGITANTLRKEWHFELKYCERDNASPLTGERSPGQFASRDSLHLAAEQENYRPTRMLGEVSAVDGIISKALAGGKRVTFDYTNKSGEHSLRTIKPLSWKRYKRERCVYGYCYLRKAERTFALSRMSHVRLVN
jgi:hypothetical protein